MGILVLILKYAIKVSLQSRTQEERERRKDIEYRDEERSSLDV